MTTEQVPSKEWRIAPGDPTCVFTGDLATPIKCMSKERAALVVAAVNAYRASHEPFVHPYGQHPHQVCGCGAKVATDVHLLHTCGDRLTPKGSSQPPGESLTIIADLLATIDRVAEQWKLKDHGCTACAPGLEGDFLCARHRAASYVDRHTLTKEGGQ